MTSNNINFRGLVMTVVVDNVSLKVKTNKRCQQTPSYFSVTNILLRLLTFLVMRHVSLFWPIHSQNWYYTMCSHFIIIQWLSLVATHLLFCLLFCINHFVVFLFWIVSHLDMSEYLIADYTEWFSLMLKNHTLPYSCVYLHPLVYCG